MKILEFLGGQGFFMILGLFVVVALLYSKWKARRYHKQMNKKRK